VLKRGQIEAGRAGQGQAESAGGSAGSAGAADIPTRWSGWKRWRLVDAMGNAKDTWKSEKEAGKLWEKTRSC